MKPRWPVRILGALIGAFLLVGTAFAHSVTFETSLNIRRSPTGTVKKGSTVTFYGTLSSPKDRCYKNSAVKLVRVGSGVVGRDTTNSAGNYSIVKSVSATAHWKARFDGKVLYAVHPHNHVCEASQTVAIKVPVG